MRIETITHLVAADAEITVEQLLSDCRQRRFAWPRQRLCWVAHEIKPKMSYPDLGRRFGRDHTTVMHAIRAVDDRISKDPQEAERCSTLITLLRGEVGAMLDRRLSDIYEVPATDQLPPVDPVTARLVRAALAGHGIMASADYAGIAPTEAQARLRALVATLAAAAGCTAIFPTVRTEEAA